VPRCSIIYSVIAKLLSLVCVAGLLSAQDAPKQDVQKGSDFIITTRVVSVPVSVTDRSGNFVNGLTPYDFELFDNGRPQIITEDVASHPISLVIVIQANSSVEMFLPKIRRLGNLVEAQLLGESGEVAVISFDHKNHLLLPFTSEPGKLSGALTAEKLRAGSYTAAVNDAMMEAVNLLKNRPPDRRRVIMVIAKNESRGSEISTREVMSAMDFAQVAVYPIDISKILSELTATPQYNRPNAIPPEARPITAGVIQTPTTDSQTEVGNWVPLIKDIFDVAKGIFVPNPLSVYSRYTGGHQYSFATQADLDKAVNRIGATLHSEYLLTYRPNTEEPGFHQIKVQVKHRDLSITTRDGYYTAGKQQ
jgi:VWFA-related protein